MPPRDLDLELQRALEHRNSASVRDLLSRRADPSAPSRDGETPLEIAVRQGSLPLCRLLLVYQADPESLRSEAAAKASEAASLVRQWGLGHVNTVFLVLEEVVLEAASEHDVSLLSLALASIDIAGGDAEQVATILDQKRNTILHLCARSTGRSASHTAEAAARLTARTLLGWGVPVDGLNDQRETALLFAMRAMHAKLRASPAKPVPAEPARALLEARADAEAVDPQTQETLLMQAAREGDVVACKLLLEFRAEPLRQNLQGESALTLAKGGSETALLLQNALGTSRGAPAASPKAAKSSPVRSSPEVIHMAQEQEEVESVQGVLNGVDLEEAYEVDWENPVLSLNKAFDEEWDHLPGQPVAAA